MMSKKSLKNAVAKNDLKQIRHLFVKTNVVDFTAIFKSLSFTQQLLVIRCLDTASATEIISRLEKSELRSLIAAFSNPEISKLVSKLYADDVVELIEDLPPYLVKKVLASTSPDQRKMVNYILRYSEDTIGSEMDVNFVALNINWQVQEAINWIKNRKSYHADRRVYYVTDERGLLIGYVDVNDLLAVKGDARTRIAAITETNVVSLRTSLLTEKAVEKMRHYELTEMPVVDQHNKLVGVLNNDDVLELIKEAQIDDINKGAGIIEEPDVEYFATKSWRMFRARFPWLAVTISITTFTQLVLAFLMWKTFETEFTFIAFIIPFIPFILTIVGNIALQSTAIVVKNIILKVIDRSTYWATLRKELVVALWILAATLLLNLPRSVIVQVVIYGWNSFDVKYWLRFAVVNLVIITSIFLAIIASTLLPIFAHWYGIDPSLMSSPLLTTMVDLLVTIISVGFAFIFFLIL